jgi:hypothetical protein
MVEGPTCSTLMGWEPIYDDDGQVTNPDPNTHTTDITCRTCKTNWVRVWRAGTISFAVQPAAP